MPGKSIIGLVSSLDDLLNHNQRVELVGVSSLNDLQAKLKAALSLDSTEEITVEVMDEDFDDYHQLHSIDACPLKAKLRISRVGSGASDANHAPADEADTGVEAGNARRKLTKRDRSLSAREALPSPACSKRFIPSAHPQQANPVTYKGITFMAGMPKRHTGQAQKEDKAKPRRWSAEEDQLLLNAVAVQGPRNWKGIAKQVPGRNHTQCLQRYAKVLKPGLVKGHWTEDEDSTLTTLVKSGWNNWGQIAEKIKGRTSKQCRERWFHHLDPSIKRGDYSTEEDRIILESHDALGNKWSQIAAKLEGRTEDAVKIRWKTLHRHRKQGKPLPAPQHSSSSCNGGSHRSSADGLTQPSITSAVGKPIVGAGGSANTTVGNPAGGMFSQQLASIAAPTSAVRIKREQGSMQDGMREGAHDRNQATTSAISQALGNLSASKECATTSAISQALGNLSPNTISVSNTVGGRFGNKAPSTHTLGRGGSMEWLENCLKSLETMDVVQSRTSTASAFGANNHGSTSTTESLFDSIGDRDGFDRLVLSLLREGKGYIQVKQHLQNQFGRSLTEAEKSRVTFVTKTADHVGIPPHATGEQDLRLSNTGLAGLELDLFDSKCAELDNMRLSASSTGSLGALVDSNRLSGASSIMAGIGMSLDSNDGNFSNEKDNEKDTEKDNEKDHGQQVPMPLHGNSAKSNSSQEGKKATNHTSPADTVETNSKENEETFRAAALSPSTCRDSISSGVGERDSFSMGAMRASLTATC